MRPQSHRCCSLEVKPLDEEKRDKLLVKILRIGESEDKGSNAIDVANELNLLRREGYDVDSYFIMFLGFLERYGLRI